VGDTSSSLKERIGDTSTSAKASGRHELPVEGISGRHGLHAEELSWRHGLHLQEKSERHELPFNSFGQTWVLNVEVASKERILSLAKRGEVHTLLKVHPDPHVG